jgi:hypothetical protein
MTERFSFAFRGVYICDLESGVPIEWEWEGLPFPQLGSDDLTTWNFLKFHKQIPAFLGTSGWKNAFENDLEHHSFCSMYYKQLKTIH